MGQLRKPALTAFAITVVALALYSIKLPAAAAPSEILTMSPTATRPEVKPGSTTHGTFQVINQGNGTLQVRIYAAPYSVKTEAYSPDFTPVPNKPVAADWLHFSSAQQTIKQGQLLTEHYTLSVPQNVQPGGYYAVAFAETRLPSAKQGVVVNERVGEIFYIHVAGPVQKSGSMVSWSSPWLQTSPLKANLRLENQGGIDYNSSIQVAVRDIFGRPKYLLVTQKEVLPQTIRAIPASWPKTPSFGLFKVNGSYTVFGQYHTLQTKYVLVMSQTLRKVFVAIVAIVLAFGLGRLVVRNKTRKPRSGPKDT